MIMKVLTFLSSRKYRIIQQIVFSFFNDGML